LKNHAYYYSTDLELEQSIERVEKQVEFLTPVVDQMLDGHLSVSTLPAGALLEAIKKVALAVSIDGYVPLVNSLAQVYECDLSYVITKTGYTVFLHIPLSKMGDQSTLWQHVEEMPLRLSDRIVMSVKTPHPYLALSQDDKTMRVFSEKEVVGCRKRGALLMCNNANVKWITPAADTNSTNPNYCAWYLYKGDLTGINATCEVHLRKPMNNAKQLHKGSFFVEAERAHDGLEHCPGMEPFPVHVNQVGLVKLREGCKLVTPFFILEARKDVAVNVSHQVSIKELSFEPEEIIRGLDHEFFADLLHDVNEMEPLPTHEKEIRKLIKIRKEINEVKKKSGEVGWIAQWMTGDILGWTSIGHSLVTCLLVVGVAVLFCREGGPADVRLR
jgi:hypothetical protein